MIEALCTENAKIEAIMLSSDNVEALYVENAIIEAEELT